jgi:osmotically-inducible protein OsmY
MVAIPRTEGNGLSDSRRIVAAAEDRLRQSLDSSLQDISCVCGEAGVLFLRGHVPTYVQKQLDQEAVLNVERVAQVVSQVEVVGRSNNGGWRWF